MLKIHPKVDVSKTYQTKAWNGELTRKLLVGSIINLVSKENAKGDIQLEQLQYIQCSMYSGRRGPVIIRLKKQRLVSYNMQLLLLMWIFLLALLKD